MHPEVECDPLIYYQKAIHNGFQIRDKRVVLVEPFIVDRFWNWHDLTSGYMLSFVDGLSQNSNGAGVLGDRISNDPSFIYFGALQLKLRQTVQNSGKRKPGLFKRNVFGSFVINTTLGLQNATTETLYQPDNTVASPADYSNSWRFVSFSDLYTAMGTTAELQDSFAMHIHFSGVKIRIG